MGKVKFKDIVTQKISTSFLFEELESQNLNDAYLLSNMFMDKGSSFYNADKIEKITFYKPISKII